MLKPTNIYSCNIFTVFFIYFEIRENFTDDVHKKTVLYCTVYCTVLYCTVRYCSAQQFTGVVVAVSILIAALFRHDN